MNPYEVLGVPRDASGDEIKEAYREKVKEYHPDTSERENAAEMFKRVKEAYEEVYADSSASAASSSSTDTSASTRDRHRRTDTDGTGTSSYSGSSASSASSASDGSGADTDKRGRKRRRKDWERRGWEAHTETDEGFGGREREKRQDASSGDEEPEGYETHSEYGLGWKLGHTDGGDWFVFTEVETAPYVDGTRKLYLDSDGRLSTEAVYFDTKQTADRCYEEYYGFDGEAEYGYGDAHGHRQKDHEGGFSQRRATSRQDEERSHRHSRQRSEGMDDGFEDADTDWGERRKAQSLDALWKLYYQEKKETTEDGGVRSRRRWSVTTDVVGDDRYVNPGGGNQTTEFWFDDRRSALSAYKKYIRKMTEARKEFEKARASHVSDEAEAPTPDDDIVFRTAEISVAFFESLEDAVEPLRRRRLTTAAVLTAFFAVAVYLFEPLRNLLVLLLTPVFVGLVTVAQTPHLTFFVVAYAAIVTILIVAQISTKY